MLDLTLKEVIQALDAEIFGLAAGGEQLGLSFPEISVDTRTLQSGQCYLALQGKRFDGHDFIPQALQRGAAALIIRRGHLPGELPAGVWMLQVDDTLAALHNLARCLRRKWSGPLLAVTGSMGKTTTREFTTALLSERFQVLQSPGNLNNEFGVPLTLMRLHQAHQFAVLELGMNHPGEIGTLSRICEPDAAVVTNVAPVHMEFFADLDAIAAAKGEILEGLKSSGTFFYNADDERVTALAARHPGRKVSFAVDSAADYRVSRCKIEALDRMSFQLETPFGLLKGRSRFAGRHFLRNLVAAVAAAATFEVSPVEIEQGLSKLRPPRQRGNLISLGTVTVWDDSYNANPQADQQILQTLAEVPGCGRKLVALGEMLELGPSSPIFHRQVGSTAASCGADLLVTVGEQGLFIGEGALAEGFPKGNLHHFRTSEEAGEFLSRELRAGDLLLIKGSRGAQMDRIVDRLRGVTV